LMVEVVDDDERYDVNLVCREEMIVTMARNKKLKIAVFGQKRIPSREGGVEIVVEELATRVGSLGYQVTVYNRSGHHVSCSEFDEEQLKSYKDVHIKTIPTIQKKGLAAVSSFFASLFSAFGNYDVVHIHAEWPAFWCAIPKFFGKRVIVTIHGECEIIWTTRENPDFMRVYAA